MRHGFDVSAGIAAAAGGRAGAWQFIRDFARWWRSPLADGDGYDEADIGAAEQRLGVRFPRRCARHISCSAGGQT